MQRPHPDSTAVVATESEASAPDTGRSFRRRGLVAGAAAFVAALAAERMTQPVAAGVDGDVALGVLNTANNTTTLVSTNTALPTLALRNNYSGTIFSAGNALQALTGNANVAAVYANNTVGGGLGVQGDASDGVGVYGTASSGRGVLGAATGNGYGVTGVSATYGVIGQTTGPGNGVYGYASSGGGNAVAGIATPGTRAGYFAGPVYATTTADIAVNAQSSASHGLAGVTTAPGTAGVLGQVGTAGTYAIWGIANAPATYAGLFQGAVAVYGNFAVTGSKSAALPHPDGSRRLVYCVEAPESWLEDFGEGKIAAGRAEVRLDPDFAALIDPRTVHVFVSEHEENRGLAVKGRSGAGFAVEADAALLAMRGKRMTDANGAFSYRVVARRKDVPADRLAKVDIPTTRATVPPPPASPPVPRIELPKPPAPVEGTSTR